MSTQNDSNRAIRNGVLLAGLLDLIAVGIGLVINFGLIEGNLNGINGGELALILFGVFFAQFLYLPLAALVAALTRHGNEAIGLLAGLGMGIIAIPTLCAGGSSFIRF